MAYPHGVTARVPVPALPVNDDWEVLLQRLVDDGTLHAEEAALARTLPPPRRATFVAGRQALRTAVRQLPDHRSAHQAPVLRTPRGAPLLPPDLTGSVTHKRTLAMAAVAPRTPDVLHLGLDLERRPTEADLTRPSIAPKILTGREAVALEGLGSDAMAERERTLVYFSLKEAVYKAIDPFVERYVRFTEVELTLDDAGGASVRLLLPELAHGRVQVEARWLLEDEWIVATATSREI